MQKRNDALWRAGVRDAAAAAALTNPGFAEVFPIEQPTLDNPTFKLLGVPLMAGKLDWLLFRGPLAVADSAMGNDDFAASDHKWLAADFVLPRRSAAAPAAAAAAPQSLSARAASPRKPLDCLLYTSPSPRD